MSLYKRIIVKSNNWYDNLPEMERTIFFLVVILAPLLVVLYLSATNEKVIWGLPIWAFLFCTWRISKVIYNWIDDYKKLNK